MKQLLLLLAIPALGISQNHISEQQAKAIAAQMSFTASPAPAENVLICEPVDLPYSENFETAAVPAMPNCTTLENAGSGNNFTTMQNPGYGFTSKTLTYHWHTTNAANAWFFTRGLNLTAGTTYNISYRYGSAGANVYTEKLKVHIGTSASVAGMDPAPLIDHPLVNNNVTPITDNLQFTPSVTGVYYVGFNCYSNIDQFYLFVDDVAVSTTLGTNSFDALKFTYSPNPAKDVLNLSAEKTIDSVTLYNLLGQKVMAVKAGMEHVTLDVQQLPKGNYLMEVTGGGESKTVKIVKE